MAVRYQVSVACENGEIVITGKLNKNLTRNRIPMEDISSLQKKCQHLDWNRSQKLSQEIGSAHFTFLNSDNLLRQALKEADLHGEPLQLFIERNTHDENVPDLPFELLYDSQFLVPLKIHVIHYVSDYGSKKVVNPVPRPLKVLFMACSPEGVEPVLDFEKEEETIFEVTTDLPVDIDIEDTGSLQGLTECLSKNEYDVIHLSGHANIEEGIPYFCMEDEEGYLNRVTPSALQEILNASSKRPRLIFLSGCKTGQSSTFVSFAHYLVAEHSPSVVGWGLPVSDPGATTAASRVYRELSKGKSILNAVFSARKELYDGLLDWSILRLFSDGTPLDIPLVEEGQEKKVKAREIQYAFLRNSQVKVLKKGFIGRRKQIQRGIKCLKKDEDKVGLLLHGTGGLGKSCLAGKFCDRFDDHTLVIVHGELNGFTFLEAAKNAFMQKEDERGLEILEETLEIPDKIRKLCLSAFQKGTYIILLDDFERNLEGYELGTPSVSGEAASILGVLLEYLPLAIKESHLIITGRYTFALVMNGRDLVKERLELIGLTSFRGADERKKVAELDSLNKYPDSDIRQKMIEAGRGNPRLMEILNSLLEVGDLDVRDLLKKIEGTKEEFAQTLLLREIMESQSDEFSKVMKYSSVYGLPVLRLGIELVCREVMNWDSLVDLGVQLSLIEEDKRDVTFYWVTLLLREEIFKELDVGERKRCHIGAVVYYRKFLSLIDGYSPEYASELIEHALKCGMDEIALEEGETLLHYLRTSLNYTEALSRGEYIVSHISNPKKDETFAEFLSALAFVYYDVRDSKKAIEYYEKALSIGIDVYGENHPFVASMLVNVGIAWYISGDSKKAIKYYEKALEIVREVYGERHPEVARNLNELGLAWHSLGDPQKAIDYYEQALEINREVYGERHPDVAATNNNLGGAWKSLGDPKKAIDYYEKALEISRNVYGERHPDVAATFNNLGLAWDSLGDPQKAIDYYEKALEIFRNVYGEKHPDVAATNNNLGGAWKSLGDPKKAIGYYEKALEIVREVYGERHPDVAATFNNLGLAWHSLGDPQKAIDYYEKALEIFRNVYGEKHPDVAATFNNLGLAWDSLGDPQKAIDYYEKALEISRNVYGERHPDVATMLNNMGMAWHSLGDPQKAIGYYEKALEIVREIYGERHPYVATTFSNLGLAWHSLGDPQKAIEYIQQAYKIRQQVFGDQHPDTKAAKEALDFLENKNT